MSLLVQGACAGALLLFKVALLHSCFTKHSEHAGTPSNPALKPNCFYEQ